MGNTVTPKVNRRTKIVATIGPACDSPDVIRAMLGAGMNVARLNLSHGTLEEHKARLDLLRKVAADIGRHIAIMIDTRGIEIRTRTLAGGQDHCLQHRGVAAQLRSLRVCRGDGKSAVSTAPARVTSLRR